MRRYYILEGDKTTVNGVVQKHTGAASTTSWHGRTVSNIDDKILCPACKSEGKIKPVGERHSFGNKGFIPALNDDLCICKCSPPPKLVHSQTVFYQDVASEVGDTSNASSMHGLNAQNNLANNLVESKDKEEKPCPPECIVKTYSFETKFGTLVISEESLKSILSFEAFVAIPYVPGKGSDGKSGVTLGYGYDLGQQPASQIKTDLKPYYTDAQINRLLVAQGKKGTAAQALVSSLSDITISKDKAYDMVMIVKKRYAEDTLSIYGDVLKLHPHCQGAMLSLVYNRGNDLRGERRKEMKEIQSDLKNGGTKVPTLLRDMKRLWTTKSDRGLQKRREDEAILFEKGLKCDCYQ